MPRIGEGRAVTGRAAGAARLLLWMSGQTTRLPFHHPAFCERGGVGNKHRAGAILVREDRCRLPEDVNLQIAITDTDDGEADFCKVTGTGLSTLHETIAQRHAGEHGYNIEKRTVVTATLTSVLDRYAPAEIHFLNIDAEGAERAILKGLDLAKHRPWIVLVEATLPNTQIESHGDWEPLLTTRGYHFVYFDGLNRFYVADEHATLDKSFHAPANAFDDFTTASAVGWDL
jgi:FkbM family methyltransferase